MEKLLKWWGYLHENGNIQAKRVFEHTVEGDIDDAFMSPFVVYVVQPFYAQSRKHALTTVREEADKWLKTQK
jgi:hypothetical protein